MKSLSAEAQTLHDFFVDLIREDWAAVSSLTDAATLARWLPMPSWRELWHEISSNRLIAYSVRDGIECISRWRNRFPEDTKALLTDAVKIQLVQSYADWTPFSWDSWNDNLISCSLQTESLDQLNKSLLVLVNANVLEVRNRGTEIRATQECVRWTFNRIPT